MWRHRLLLSPDRNVAHRTLIMLQSLVEGGSTAFRRGMRTHCQEALNTALAFPTDGSRAERKTELDDVIHNHALVLLKTIAIQPNDEVEVCMPDGDWRRAKVTTVSPVEIVTTLQESSEGDVSRRLLLASVLHSSKSASNDRADRSRRWRR